MGENRSWCAEGFQSIRTRKLPLPSLAILSAIIGQSSSSCLSRHTYVDGESLFTAASKGRLFRHVTASKNAGDVAQHIGRAFIVVSMVSDKPLLDDVNFFLRLLIDYA